MKCTFVEHTFNSAIWAHFHCRRLRTRRTATFRHHRCHTRKHKSLPLVVCSWLSLLQRTAHVMQTQVALKNHLSSPLREATRTKVRFTHMFWLWCIDTLRHSVSVSVSLCGSGSCICCLSTAELARCHADLLSRRIALEARRSDVAEARQNCRSRKALYSEQLVSAMRMGKNVLFMLVIMYFLLLDCFVVCCGFAWRQG